MRIARIAVFTIVEAYQDSCISTGENYQVSGIDYR
jgi:hypothetical protein